MADSEPHVDGHVDLLRIDNDQIAQVWLFSSDQEAEDAFWDNG